MNKFNRHTRQKKNRNKIQAKMKDFRKLLQFQLYISLSVLNVRRKISLKTIFLLLKKKFVYEKKRWLKVCNNFSLFVFKNVQICATNDFVSLLARKQTPFASLNEQECIFKWLWNVDLTRGKLLKHIIFFSLWIWNVKISPRNTNALLK